MSRRETQFVVLGVDYTTAPLAVRETLGYDETAAGALLDTVPSIPGVREAMVLSTCNRTEFYLVTDRGAGGVERWLDRVRRERPDAGIGHASCVLARWTGVDAVRHLFRVACGLESSLLGDVHIPGQLKAAFRAACERGAVGPVLGYTCQQAFRVVKRARTETEIGRGAASLGSAVRALLDEHHPAVHGTTLIIGAGRVARDVARHLSKRRTDSLVFINRTAVRAAELARECGGRAVPWAALDTALATADVVVAATATSAPLIRAAELETRRGGAPLLIDLGMPRNVEPSPRVRCVTIDDITARRDAALARRQRAVPGVERVIEQALEHWCAWWAQRPREEIIKQLYLDESQKRAELVARLHDGWHGPANDLDRLVRASMRAMLHTHVHGLRSLIMPAFQEKLRTVSSSSKDLS